MDSGDEDDQPLGAQGKDWDKTNKDLMTEGYREGIDQAKNDEIQKYFEIVQQLYFKNTFRLGQLRGIILAGALASPNHEVSPPLKEILQNLSEEVKRIKKVRLPPATDFDEFLKAQSALMDERFETLKQKLLELNPNVKVHLDSLEVGKSWPILTPAPPAEK